MELTTETSTLLDKDRIPKHIINLLRIKFHFNNLLLIKNKTLHMRNTQLTNSSKKTEPISRSRSKSKSLSSNQVENKFYFCHYKNAMYMGGMKSFHRNGYGIIIHDNGSSSICSHYHDFKHGHNIVFS